MKLFVTNDKYFHFIAVNGSFNHIPKDPNMPRLETLPKKFISIAITMTIMFITVKA